MLPGHASAEPFFLATSQGEAFCLYHAAQGMPRGALVYIHPFGEEMNKSRRMAALQARALAADGFAVLQIDLHGCGDSDGEFADARWEHWLADIGAACAWLRERSGRPVGLWGLRLGALLALDYAGRAGEAPAQLLLWQPVLQGSTFMTQFLRLRVASAMLDDGAAPEGGTKALRATLAAGHRLEVAGYDLAPELLAEIDARDAATMQPPCPVHWIEIVAAPERPAPPAAVRVAGAWGTAVHTAAGPQFWTTQEIEECPALIALTRTLLAGRHE